MGAEQRSHYTGYVASNAAAGFVLDEAELANLAYPQGHPRSAYANTCAPEFITRSGAGLIIYGFRRSQSGAGQ
jgi:hypothetical protein